MFLLGNYKCWNRAGFSQAHLTPNYTKRGGEVSQESFLVKPGGERPPVWLLTLTLPNWKVGTTLIKIICLKSYFAENLIN